MTELSRTQLRRAKAICLEWEWTHDVRWMAFDEHRTMAELLEIKAEIRQRHWSRAMALILADAMIRS